MAGRRSRDQRITPELLLRAYSIGLFPMSDAADDPEIFWVEPELRGIIPLDHFHVSKSLAKAIRHKPFDIRYDTAFDRVLDLHPQVVVDVVVIAELENDLARGETEFGHRRRRRGSDHAFVPPVLCRCSPETESNSSRGDAIKP